LLRDIDDTTLKPHSRVEVLPGASWLKQIQGAGYEIGWRAWCVLTEKAGMATRERRLAEFNGEGEPPPNQPVQVLCEDHSGTYQLPFPCRFIDGTWLNHESGGAVEATVVGWRMRRP
jgi:hypothetical protein